MKLIFSSIAVAMFLTGCNSNRGPSLDPVHVNALLLNQPIFVQNNERQYHLYLPADSRTAPIVVLLHGNGGSNDQILGLTGTKAPHKVWLDIAQQENIILVVPNGAIGPNDKRGWNDCRTDAPTNPDTDDVRFISELVEFVQNSYGSGTTSVFSVGTSNGGFMSMRLAAEIPDTIDAIAILVASKPVNSECIESVNPVSVLIMNGTNDPILPYYGGQIVSNRGEVFSAAETVNYWINRNQTDLTASVLNIPNTDPDDNSTVIRYSHTNGINNTAVENYIITNGGHTEPSIAERYGNLYKLVVGNQNGDIEMATEVWNFFRSQ